jgi:hypothetical protein
MVIKVLPQIINQIHWDPTESTPSFLIRMLDTNLIELQVLSPDIDPIILMMTLLNLEFYLEKLWMNLQDKIQLRILRTV